MSTLVQYRDQAGQPKAWRGPLTVVKALGWSLRGVPVGGGVRVRNQAGAEWDAVAAALHPDLSTDPRRDPR